MNTQFAETTAFPQDSQIATMKNLLYICYKKPIFMCIFLILQQNIKILINLG